MQRYNAIYNKTVPVFEKLLRDIFWIILSMCEKGDILNLRLVSSTMYEKIYVPIYPPLSTFPFVLEVLNTIEKIEQYERNSKTIRNYVAHASIVVNKFPDYDNVLYNIVDCCTYYKFSPTFWFFDGRIRVKKLIASHGINLDQRKPLYLRILTSIAKDLLVNISICFILSISSICSGVYIYNLYESKVTFLLSEKFLVFFLFLYIFHSYIIIGILVIIMVWK
jgi:hypothetical protein